MLNFAAMKHVAIFVAGVSVLALTLMPILVPPDHLVSVRWKITTWVTALVAIIALYVQEARNRQEEREHERREREMYALLQKIAAELAKPKAKRRGIVTGLPSATIAGMAETLLNNAVRFRPKQELNLVAMPGLHDVFHQATSFLGAFPKSEFALSVPPDEIRRVAGELLILAVQKDREEQQVEV